MQCNQDASCHYRVMGWGWTAQHRSLTEGRKRSQCDGKRREDQGSWIRWREVHVQPNSASNLNPLLQVYNGAVNNKQEAITHLAAACLAGPCIAARGCHHMSGPQSLYDQVNKAPDGNHPVDVRRDCSEWRLLLGEGKTAGTAGEAGGVWNGGIQVGASAP